MVLHAGTGIWSFWWPTRKSQGMQVALMLNHTIIVNWERLSVPRFKSLSVLPSKNLFAWLLADVPTTPKETPLYNSKNGRWASQSKNAKLIFTDSVSWGEEKLSSTQENHQPESDCANEVALADPLEQVDAAPVVSWLAQAPCCSEESKPDTHFTNAPADQWANIYCFQCKRCFMLQACSAGGCGPNLLNCCVSTNARDPLLGCLKWGASAQSAGPINHVKNPKPANFAICLQALGHHLPEPNSKKSISPQDLTSYSPSAHTTISHHSWCGHVRGVKMCHRDYIQQCRCCNH